MRTTGAPKSVTAGAAGAAGAKISGGARRGKGAGGRELPSGIPAFLEACAKVAGEAVARGDLARARELFASAARVAALQGDA
jgi:hypothetical protein